MREYRPSKEETERYTSLSDLRKAWGLKDINKQTKDTEKLKTQKESFCNRHICKCCGQPMSLISGTSVMACTNDKCKGQKHEIINDETNEKKVWYTPSFDLLDEKGLEISQNIFA